MLKILIGGDVCPVGRNRAYFARGDAAGVFGDLLGEFAAADLTIVNLECALIEKESPILKSGPVLGVESECVNGLKNTHIDVIGMANNHILDHGEQGLRNTIKVCREAGMRVVGAGENLADAREILSLQVKDVRVGILALAEHEFSIATKDKPGANPLDLMEFVRQMRRYREKFDYVVVLLHSGKEYYPYPSPELQQRCRFMIEEGANAVICQQSHCPGCYEHYEGGFISYGQGNLIFDAHPQRKGTWNQGYLVKLSIEAGGTCETSIMPYIQSDSKVGARRMTKGREEAFKRELQERSARIKEEGFVEKQWQEFCMTKRYIYFSKLRGHNRLLRGFNRLVHFSDWFYSRTELRTLRHVIRCETLREVLDTVLSNS